MKKMRKNWPTICFFLFWVAYFANFWSKAIFFDPAGNFWAGNVNLWGDWAAHFTIATAMATRGLFIRSPFLLGANFSYPFVADFISGVMLRIGFPFITSFIIPSFIFSMMLVTALFFFYKTVLRSSKVAIIASFIFLCNGGIGFYFYLKDVIQSSQPLFVLLHPLHEYTRIDQLGIRWISVIDSMIIPERSFALGFSCALIALTIVYKIFFASTQNHSNSPKFWQLVLVGILLGILPILHTHSFLATFIFLSWWAILDLFWLTKPIDRWRHFQQWSVIAIITSFIAIPLIYIFFMKNLGHNFFHWYPGWMASDFKLNWFVFTWRNWGITPILALVSLWWSLKSEQHRVLGKLLLPSFLLFMLCNLFLFQPWSWDNTKLFVWFLLGSSGVIAIFLSNLPRIKFLKKLRRNYKNVLIKKLFIGLAMSLFLITTASGAIDAYRIQRIQLHSYIEYNSSEISLANWVKENTSPTSIWLTGHPHNHWLFNLTGRQTILAYPGWLWTQGYDYLPIQFDVAQMYAGNEDSLDLLQKYQVNYVVIGPNELKELFANQSFFDQRFPVVEQLGQTKIYKLK